MLRSCILLILTFTVVSGVFGQEKLKDNLVDGSTAYKLKIKRVIENGFGNVQDTKPYWTTIEVYDTTGRITQRTSVNYAYHKFIYDFQYTEGKNEIKVIEKYHDWNPYRKKNKNDTALKTSIEKYDIKTRENRKHKPSGLSKFKTHFSLDSLGRIIQSTDTIKCGYRITYYLYDSKNNLIERNHFETRHSETSELIASDRLVYDIKGQKIKEINFYDFGEKEGIKRHGRETETVFRYDDLGLLKEKLITTRYPDSKDSKPDSTLYKYDYEFY